MLNERQEFLDYTEPVEYRSSGKKDTAWLGRFTFEALRDFSGLARILTILALVCIVSHYERISALQKIFPGLTKIQLFFTVKPLNCCLFLNKKRKTIRQDCPSS